MVHTVPTNQESTWDTSPAAAELVSLIESWLCPILVFYCVPDGIQVECVRYPLDSFVSGIFYNKNKNLYASVLGRIFHIRTRILTYIGALQGSEIADLLNCLVINILNIHAVLMIVCRERHVENDN